MDVLPGRAFGREEGAAPGVRVRRMTPRPAGPSKGDLLMAEARFGSDLRAECGEWIWEQLQEDGIYIAGELIDLIVETERELAIHTRPLAEIARLLEEEFQLRGITAAPGQLDASLIQAVLEWEDEFLGFAGIRREES